MFHLKPQTFFVVFRLKYKKILIAIFDQSRLNVEDMELMKMFNPTLKIRETILFFLIVVNLMINGLICIDSDIGLDMCARRR